MGDSWSLRSSPDRDSDDSAAVEEIISQAIDLSTLQQIAALNININTSHLDPADSVLPNHLETRFRNLKSFPGTAHHPNHYNHINYNNPGTKIISKPEPKSPSYHQQQQQQHDDHDHHHHQEKNTPTLSDDELLLGLKPDDIDELLLSDSSPVPRKLKKDHLLDPTKPRRRRRRRRSSSGSFSISSKSCKEPAAEASSVSHSPHKPKPKPTCCFWSSFSPKKIMARKKKNVKGEKGLGSDDGGKTEILSSDDLSSFSMKDHQRKMEKMLKEQEMMITREAEKVLKLAKQLSAKY